VQKQLKEMQEKLQLEKEAKDKEIEEQMKRLEQEKVTMIEEMKKK
jgi:hypothetical protein